MNKEKYTLEYELKTAPVMLVWNYIATANGLAQWFADKVELHDKVFTFYWRGQATTATQTSARLGSFIRMKWNDDSEFDKFYFELKIVVSDITDSTTLLITDFAEKDDLSSAKELWDHQIVTLSRLLGCKN